jgi:hypothetical protein
VAEGQSNNNMVKGCAIAAGVVAILGCCGFGVFSIACGGLMNVGQETQLGVISSQLHASTTGNPRAAEYEAELTRFDGVRPSVTFLTFGVLSNRYNDAMADGRIDATELDHVMELIRDIDARNGNVDISQYPGGR